MQKVYDIQSRKPVARFYYKGSHSHPVRRTVLVIEENDDVLVGYELRVGRKVRTVNEAKQNIRSYSKDKIARYGDYSRLRRSSRTVLRDASESTLERLPLSTIFEQGV